MPTVCRIGPYRFYFYSHEPNEPPHIHVDRDSFSAKFWLKDSSLADNLGFNQKELNILQKLVGKHQKQFLGRWHEYFLTLKTRIEAVYFTRDSLVVDLIDGRTISVPLTWYPKLLKASPRERAHWEICGGGYGIHWPKIDEDLSVEGLLRGSPAPTAKKVRAVKRTIKRKTIQPVKRRRLKSRSMR